MLELQERRPPTPPSSLHAAAEIRAYRPEDRDAVRAICCLTAFRNLGAAAMLDDAELFADYWSGYYTDHEPASCLVFP